MKCIIRIACASLLVGIGVQPASANPWNPMTSALPMPGPIIPAARDVPGKDFSDHLDRDATGIGDPEQLVAWDGIGGVRDSFDYSGSRPPNLDQDHEVDAVGNNSDALFQTLRDDRAALIFSVGDVGSGGVVSDPTIYFEPAAGFGGPMPSGVWATASDLDAMNLPTDVDGLEVWGTDANDDSDRYSLYGDPFFQVPGGPGEKVAVWGFTPGVSAPHTLTRDLAMAMDRQYGFDRLGPLFGQLVELMDVDAIMVDGERLTYSIAPLDLSFAMLPNFDGGEIFEYDGPGSTTRFLRHGGHVWDTAFNVINSFGVNSENVDAIEAVAVPEPASGLLTWIALAALIQLGRKRSS